MPVSRPAQRPRQPRRKWLFRLLALALGAGSIVALEMALIVLGIGEPNRYDDPFVGFSEIYPLFTHDDTRDVYRTSAAKRISFDLQQFDAQKPPGTFRVFCLGGSTVRGRPYETPTSFATWLELELDASAPEIEHEVINCGGLSYASYRLAKILEEVLDHDPDLIIIATGHNEFLEDRTYEQVKQRSDQSSGVWERISATRIVTAARQLKGLYPTESEGGLLRPEVSPRLDQVSGYASYHRDDGWRDSIVLHFRHSLDSMIRMCRQREVPLLLVKLGSNLRDCPPFKTEHRPGLSTDEQSRWRVLFQEATRLQDDDVAAALEKYQQAARIDDEHALLNWRMAVCFDWLGRNEEAAKHYHRARQFDVCPLRAVDELNQVLQDVAAAAAVPLVDIESLVNNQAKQGVPGFDLFVDHVHPTIGLHQKMAREIAVALRQQEIVSGDELPEAEYRRIYREQLTALGGRYQRDGLRRVEWLEKWAQRQRLLGETEPVDARGYLHRGFKWIGFGNAQRAWADFDIAIEIDRQSGDAILQHALSLFEQGNPRLADELVQGIEQRETLADYHTETMRARAVLDFELHEVPASRLSDRVHELVSNRDPNTSGWGQELLRVWRAIAPPGP